MAMVCSGLACTSKSVEPLSPSTHGYTFSLRVSDGNIWLGPRRMGDDPRPDTAGVVAEVRDRQGHRVDSVPVTFHMAPPWVLSATVLPASHRDP